MKGRGNRQNKARNLPGAFAAEPDFISCSAKIAKRGYHLGLRGFLLARSRKLYFWSFDRAAGSGEVDAGARDRDCRGLAAFFVLMFDGSITGS